MSPFLQTAGFALLSCVIPGAAMVAPAVADPLIDAVYATSHLPNALRTVSDDDDLAMPCPKNPGAEPGATRIDYSYHVGAPKLELIAGDEDPEAGCDGRVSVIAAAPDLGISTSTVPKQLVLEFSDAVDLASTGVALLTQYAVRVPLGTASLASDDRAQLVVPITPALTHGFYVVYWYATTLDKHRNSGTYSFTLTP